MIEAFLKVASDYGVRKRKSLSKSSCKKETSGYFCSIKQCNICDNVKLQKNALMLTSSQANTVFSIRSDVKKIKSEKNITPPPLLPIFTSDIVATMDDNSLSDDEVKESPLSPVMGGKKLKLNDGSSQDSSSGSASSSKVEKDENADSGVSADKSESTSSEERAVEPLEGPSNVVVNAAPSSSIHGIVLNIRRPRLNRCYRKRKTPDRDSDSDNSLRDSDDYSAEESPPASRRMSNTSGDSVDLERALATFSDVSRSPSNSHSSSSPSSNNSDSDNELNLINTDDTDSDDGSVWTRSNIDSEDKAKTASVLSKPRPKHSYFILREIINREMGLSLPNGRAVKEDVMFEKRFYGSLHSVYRLKKLHHLNKHKGCVNSINFHPEGQLLASGSDDTNVVVWDWARQAVLQTIKTGHKSNVFQSKFLHLNARSQLNIVTCARDGQVRLLQCPPSGGATVSRRRLASHARAAHKLHVCAAEPHLVVSAGEDGVVMQCDVRAEVANKLFHVKEAGSSIPLYSVSGHPLEPRLLCVAGRDRFVRVYDARHATKPRDLYCPSSFHDHETDKKKLKYNMMHLTCAIYNHDGGELLGSYNDEDIYLFDTKRDVYDKSNPDKETNGYTHKYSGHRNSATFKGVAFFGPQSQYVVSGSDCSHIYIWEKHSEAIVQWMEGDVGGVVNCIETHPRSPVLASSGLDKDVKIWIPSSDKEPDYAGLEKILLENSTSQRSPLFSDFLPTLYNAWRGENRLFTDEDRAPPYGGNIEFDGNVCTAF